MYEEVVSEDNGKKFAMRSCESDDHECVVIEEYTNYDDGGHRAEPDHEVHIPRRCFEALIAGYKEFPDETL